MLMYKPTIMSEHNINFVSYWHDIYGDYLRLQNINNILLDVHEIFTLHCSSSLSCMLLAIENICVRKSFATTNVGKQRKDQTGGRGLKHRLLDLDLSSHINFLQLLSNAL